MKMTVPINDITDKLKKRSGKWDFANSILYDLCRTNPDHTDEHKVVAKIWLIGRSYAAAIERRINADETATNDFYYDEVAPKMLSIGSELDERIRKINSYKHISSENLPFIIETHGFLMTAFRELTDLDKRSLASKYLHFHCPNAFYIFDTRAKNAIPKYIRDDRNNLDLGENELYDQQYLEFCLRLYKLQEAITEATGETPTPRELDNLLLEI